MRDGWGYVNSLNITASDTDEEGLDDRYEVKHKLGPRNPDTDGDGFNDGWEKNNGYDPMNSNVSAIEMLHYYWFVEILLLAGVILVLYKVYKNRHSKRK